jgi:hypothetical protein
MYSGIAGWAIVEHRQETWAAGEWTRACSSLRARGVVASHSYRVRALGSVEGLGWLVVVTCCCCPDAVGAGVADFAAVEPAIVAAVPEWADFAVGRQTFHSRRMGG